jgi:hypothetical protein
VKQIPILLNGEMVRAILDGQKTQTRRVVKSIDHDLLDMMSEDAETGAPDSELLELLYGPSTDDNGKSVADQWLVRCTECPEEGVLTLGQGFGRIGDRLWVRETHAFVPQTAYRCSTGIYQQVNPNDNYEACVYRQNFDRSRSFPWRPSIHMPRWASRIMLEVTDVRVEQLQDVSDSGAKAEGITVGKNTPQAVDQFCRLWRDINGEESWSANPWVWVIEFKRVDSGVVS